MSITRLLSSSLFVASLFIAAYASAGVEKIYVLKEIDDDHIIIVTEAGEQLLLEKWNLRLSPLVFEGKYFIAEVSPLWVTIHFDDRESIKWSVEKSLGSIAPKAPSKKGKVPSLPAPKRSSGRCFKSSIREPSPFLGNGGEIIIFDDGSIWKEDSYQYLYLYEYYPNVIVCPSDGIMILREHVFQIIPAR